MAQASRTEWFPHWISFVSISGLIDDAQESQQTSNVESIFPIIF